MHQVLFFSIIMCKTYFKTAFLQQFRPPTVLGTGSGDHLGPISVKVGQQPGHLYSVNHVFLTTMFLPRVPRNSRNWNANR